MKSKYIFLGLVAVLSILTTTVVCADDPPIKKGIWDGSLRALGPGDKNPKIVWAFTPTGNSILDVDLESFSVIYWAVTYTDETSDWGIVTIRQKRVSVRDETIYLVVDPATLPIYDPEKTVGPDADDKENWLEYKVDGVDYHATGPGWLRRRRSGVG